jgi:hypothetical protein
MPKFENILLDFEIDKLTNSIENSITGEIFQTGINKINLLEISQIKKADWISNYD